LGLGKIYLNNKVTTIAGTEEQAIMELFLPCQMGYKLHNQQWNGKATRRHVNHQTNVVTAKY